jgi:hypothetical protein
MRARVFISADLPPLRDDGAVLGAFLPVDCLPRQLPAGPALLDDAARSDGEACAREQVVEHFLGVRAQEVHAEEVGDFLPRRRQIL